MVFTASRKRGHQATVRGKFREIGYHPNGVCQSHYNETEVYIGMCLNKGPCCLSMGHQPRGENATTKS
ncbi:beta-defensin 108B [Peromyscus maniculatus bairdii]|uniref:beta-defensin 108B n=1 Tax=Peromyscus maniculatus bairdii TaxID=230844 RepID=UPI003FD48558